LHTYTDCRNRILHCDVEPHNVLVDVDFFPEVEDLGLAKISNRKDSHISPAHERTSCYTAPKMCSRIHGPVADRCDVCSYGTLLMRWWVAGRILMIKILVLNLHNYGGRGVEFGALVSKMGHFTFWNFHPKTHRT